MKHTECKDCELSNGDCGYHFKMDGKTNYDIPSLSACDKYGNCEFFKSKAKTQGDLISREALKDKLTDTINVNDITKSEWYEGYAACVQVLSELIDNAPEVNPCKDCDLYFKAMTIKAMREAKQNGIQS